MKEFKQARKIYEKAKREFMEQDEQTAEEPLELLPCPFCGGQAQIRSTTDRLPLYWVECYLCEIGTKWNDSPEGASKTWNTRAGSRADTDLRQEAIALCLSVGISDNKTNIKQAEAYLTDLRSGKPPTGIRRMYVKSVSAGSRADDEELLTLLNDWVNAKAEYFRFGREEYAHKMSPLYAKEHNLSADDVANLQAQVREQMEQLNDKEHKAQWALYSTARKQRGGAE